MMGHMSVKSLPWVNQFLSDLGLEDHGGGFWSSPDSTRSVYLGDATLVVTTSFTDDEDLRTQYVYPTRVTEQWVMDMLWDHIEEMDRRTADLAERMRWN